MGNRWKKLTKDMFVKTFFLLLLIIMLPIACLFLLYGISSRTIEQKEQDSMLAAVVNCTEKLEKEMDDVTSIISYLTNDPQILRYLYYFNLERDSSSLMEIIDAQDTLKSLALTQDKITLIQVYANGSDTLIDNKNSAQYLNRYYAHFQMGDMSYEEWHAFIQNGTIKYEVITDTEYTYDGVTHPAWVFSYRIPIHKTSGNYGQAFLFIDKGKLLQDFSVLDYRNQGYLVVVNNEHEIMLMDNESGLEQERILEDVTRIDQNDSVNMISENGQEMFLIRHYSPELQATVAMAVSVSYVYAPINGIRNFLFGLIGIAVVICVMLVIQVARRLSKPWTDLSSLLQKKGTATPAELAGEISELLDHNESLKQEVMGNLSAVRTAALYNLLLCGFENRESFEKGIDLLEIERDARQYGLLIIYISNLEYQKEIREISIQQAFLGNTIQQELKEVQGVYFPDHERMLVLFAMNENSKQDAEHQMEEHLDILMRPLFERHHLEVTIVGDVAEDLTAFPGMYLRTQSVLSKNRQRTEKRIAWYSQEKKKYAECYYPAEMDDRLGAIMIMGNTEALAETFQELKLANARIFELNCDEQIRKLLGSIYDTLCKKQKEYRLHGAERLDDLKIKIQKNLIRKEHLADTFHLLEEAFYTCMVLNGDVWEEQQLNLSERIHLYICNNYRNQQLCLSMIAEKFSITESYLSRLYKQSFKKTCNKAIESLRLEDAARQLTQGKSVVDVAESVGYNSVQVFRRAYKRYYGTTPSESKENQE